MSQPIIITKNISKKYDITSQQGGYVALRDVLTNVAKSPFSFLKHKAKEAVGKTKKEEFWALKNINFEVKKGEAIGIIGANGAGKSTLLKILTGITPPTTGEIEMRGKVASLLEVGTGFHPELSGRENIFLNGAILGMTKKEIGVKFNDIVKFSGIEKFLDTPVKRYSSGMYVRLAFSVAAHMEPDILLVDEVLAVGDADFQKKCLGKMDEVTKKAGRTILFVSHNMAAIQNLCKRCILLRDGRIEIIGETQNVIGKYINNTHHNNTKKIFTSTCKKFSLKMPYWINKKEKKMNIYSFGENYILRFNLLFFKPVLKINLGIAVVNSFGQRIFTNHLLDDKTFSFKAPLKNQVVIDAFLNLPSLAPGIYQIIFGVRDENEQTVIYSNNSLKLEIQEYNKDKDGADGILWHTGIWKQIQ